MFANENFTAAHRIVDEIQDSLFRRLESCKDSVQAQAIEGAIDERLKSLEQYVDRIEISVNKTSGSQRNTMKLKLDQLKYDHKHLLSSFRTLHQRRLHREREHREREELLTRRFTTNAELRSQNNDTQIDLGVQEYFDQEHNKLGGFNRHVDEMITTGSTVLSTLRQQRSMLKNTRKNLLDTLNSIGLSNSVMRLIEKRHIGDKFVLFGGMTLMTILMFLIWFYLT
ncbi:Golgi SNAP receptor complex member 2 [Dermatophagoides farinae]|uniref:Golgi SNAP receptor complex member 2 n=1 Tax=Dermatophagoides farinae TaxID=6954 RepID=A0A922HSP8_DERFA|nr:golgi snap receptor complex member 2-like protein [Dermatophagoides farinae]KAH9507003.1 Golgi SNAP receptor complex member 2 [Dermatophagoides farinae]